MTTNKLDELIEDYTIELRNSIGSLLPTPHPDDFKQAIEAYIAERETQARIDELNVLEKTLDDPKYSYPGEDGWEYDMYKYLEDRENALKSNERVSNESNS